MIRDGNQGNLIPQLRLLKPAFHSPEKFMPSWSANNPPGSPQVQQTLSHYREYSLTKQEPAPLAQVLEPLPEQERAAILAL